jgi:hypothetical protein
MLSACASGDEYPSLALRPAERISADPVTSAPTPSPAATAPSPQFAGRLARLVEQAREAHQRFAARRGDAERIIAGADGAAPASESWSQASVALADLAAARSDATVALAELDGLYASESTAGAESGNMGNADAAAAAREQVGVWVAEEDSVLDALRARLDS